MLKTNYRILLLTLSVFISLISYKKSSDPIVWYDGEKLTWNDFKGRADIRSHFHAMTNSGLSFSAEYNGTDLKFDVKAIFTPKKSWVKKGKENKKLLEHEQLHFDITELHARILREKYIVLDSLIKLNSDTINDFFNSVFQDHHKMQHLYDEETEHSIDSIAQKRWETKIALALDSLDEYKLKKD